MRRKKKKLKSNLRINPYNYVNSDEGTQFQESG